MKKVFFVDFDGTITKKDTCSAMVEVFTNDGGKVLDKLWEAKKLTTEECANIIFKMFNAGPDDIESFLNTIDIDDYFKEFITLCRKHNHRVYILSDGYDFNIKTILGRYDIKAEYHANRLLYHPETGFGIECTYSNQECKSCGTCKTSLINKLKEDGDEVYYIGDGYSDTCPAAIADVVFAKGYLYRFCLENGIEAVPYSDFSDIIGSLRLR